MELTIKIDKPPWQDKAKTNTDNWKWGNVVTMVSFENQTFIWIPSYKQLEDIKKALHETERINKEKCKEYNGDKK